MDDLFVPTKGNTSVTLYPRDLNNQINARILKKLKSQLEGKCIKEGFVREGSVKMLNRSLGHGQAATFDGSITFYVEYSMEVCNPLEGVVIEVQALNVNKMGVLAGIPYQAQSPLYIMLAKQHHIDDEEIKPGSKSDIQFDKINVDDVFKVRVVGKRFEYGDTQITIIAVLESVYTKFKA